MCMHPKDAYTYKRAGENKYTSYVNQDTKLASKKQHISADGIGN